MSSRGAEDAHQRVLRRAFLGLAFAAVVSVAGCKSSTSPTKAYDIAALQKIDTVVGTGAEAVNGRTVTVHYTGWVYDPAAVGNKGTKFDSSVDRNQPFSFTLGAGQVIQGWEQGVPGMKVGGKRTLLIPSALAYRSTGSGVIPPNSAIVFDIEVLNVT